MNWPSTRPSLLIRIRDCADHQAWQEFVTFYAPVIQSYCQSKGLSHSDAEDVVQDALFIVSRVVPRFRYQPAKGRFRSWLATVINHEIYRRWQRAGRAPTDEIEQPATLIDSNAVAGWNEHLSQAVVQAAFETVQHEFSAEQWNVFELLWYERESATSLAERMGRKRSWMYKTKSIILRRIEEVVRELTDDAPLA